MDWYFTEIACLITLIKFFGPGYVYFTDWRLGGIVRVRKTDGGEMMIIRRGISHIMHVKSFNADTQIGESHFHLFIDEFTLLSFCIGCNVMKQIAMKQ